MIAPELLEEIRNKVDIVQLISEYVRLRQRGKNYLGLCPFHSEKDPSFTVSPEKQLWHCFGCGEGGNIFAFLMKIENISFVEAAQELAQRAGISLPQLPRQASVTSSRQQKLLQVMELATRFYQQVLQSAVGEAARHYLASRGISQETCQLFRLGFAPAKWDELFRYLFQRGVAPADMEASGLVLPRENQDGYYDRFRQRLIFPLIDQRQRVLAFGGRSLSGVEPKYLNSPETSIYRKASFLFGLHLTKNFIKQKGCAILVEGNFDLLSSFQSGTTNAVATMGTALTPAQIKLLARYTSKVILAYDADAAGSSAAERSAELLWQQGLQVKVADLRGGKDPDELIRQQGSESWENCLRQALPYLHYKIQKILGRYNLQEVESRAQALQEIAALLAKEKETFIIEEYAQLAAQKLQTSKERVVSEVRKRKHYRWQSPSGGGVRHFTPKPPSKIASAEKNLLSLVLQDPQLLAATKEKIQAADFSLPAAQSLAQFLWSLSPLPENTVHFLLDNLPDTKAKNLLSEIMLQQIPSCPKDREMMLQDCLHVLQKEKQEKRIKHLKEAIKAAETAGEAEKAQELLAQLNSEIYQTAQR